MQGEAKYKYTVASPPLTFSLEFSVQSALCSNVSLYYLIDIFPNDFDPASVITYNGQTVQVYTTQ